MLLRTKEKRYHLPYFRARIMISLSGKNVVLSLHSNTTSNFSSSFTSIFTSTSTLPTFSPVSTLWPSMTEP